MGEVWKARDTCLGRIVAIKKANEQHSERLKREARTIEVPILSSIRAATAAAQNEPEFWKGDIVL